MKKTNIEENEPVFEDVEIEDKYRRFSTLMEQTGKMTNKEVQKLFEGLKIDEPTPDDKYT